MRDALDHLPMETRVVFFAYLSPWFNHVLWKRKTSDCILELFIFVTKSLSRLFTPTLLTSILVTLRFFFNNRPSFEATPIHPANILSEKVLVENYKTILSKILRKIQRSVEYCSTAFQSTLDPLPSTSTKDCLSAISSINTTIVTSGSVSPALKTAVITHLFEKVSN